MSKTITWTLKIDKLKKQAVNDFCREEGLLINKIAEKALENEIERRLIAKSASVFKDYEKRKEGAISFEEAEKRISRKGK